MCHHFSIRQTFSVLPPHISYPDTHRQSLPGSGMLYLEAMLPSVSSAEGLIHWQTELHPGPPGCPPLVFSHLLGLMQLFHMTVPLFQQRVFSDLLFTSRDLVRT